MSDLFDRESRTLEKYNHLLVDNAEADVREYKAALAEVSDGYNELLLQTKFLTKISDRLENRLQVTNKLLAQKNEELKSTLDALTVARVGRRAFAIIYAVAATLFIFEEYIIEPILPLAGTWIFAAVFLKFIIALSLKPIEKVLEDTFLKNRNRKKIHEAGIAKS